MAYSVEHTSEFWDDQFGNPVDLEIWHCYGFEYVDELSFMPKASEALKDWNSAEQVIQAVSKKFDWMGWEGDGDIQLMWLPPFVKIGPYNDFGSYLFFVKQSNDGVAYLISRHKLPFKMGFKGSIIADE